MKRKKMHIIEDKDKFFRMYVERALKITEPGEEFWLSILRKNMKSYPAHKNWFGCAVRTKFFMNNFEITKKIRTCPVPSTKGHIERMYRRKNIVNSALNLVA